MLDRFKGFWQGVMLRPVVDLFLRLGISPDAVTLVGTLGVAGGALVFFPTGHLVTGALVIVAFVFSDLVDGAMARKLGHGSTFGAFWDSTLDRVGDGAIFVGLALYFARDGAAYGDSFLYLCVTLYCLVTGSVTSYARARAESLGLDAKGGIAERADRLVATLAAAFFAGLLGLDVILYVVLWVLAAASTYTVVFRVRKVRRQALARDAAVESGA